MAPRNAFCGIMDRVNGTFLYFVPEADGGKRLRFEDVDEMMHHLRFSYDKQDYYGPAYGAGLLYFTEKT